MGVGVTHNAFRGSSAPSSVGLVGSCDGGRCDGGCFAYSRRYAEWPESLVP